MKMVGLTPRLPNPLIDQKLLSRSDRWLWIGDDNLYPQAVNRVVRESATLKAVLASKADITAGHDWKGIEGDAPEWLAAPNPYQDINELVRMAALDYFQHGNTCFIVQVVGSTPTIHVQDWSTVRLGEDLDRVYVSKNWYRYRELKDRKYKPKEIPLWPNFGPVEGKPGLFSALHCPDYEPGFHVYGLPKWVGAMPYARTEWLIGQFKSGYLSNGAFMSAIVAIDPSGKAADDDRTMAEWFKREMLGTDENVAGRVLVVDNYREQGGNPVQVEKLSHDFNNELKDWAELCGSEIISAAQWYRSVAGLATAGQLGNTQQIQNEYTLALNSVKSTREKLLAKINMIGAFFGLSDNYKLEVNQPVSASEQALNGAQVNAMVEVIASVNRGEIGSNSAARMISKAFGLTMEDAMAMVNDTSPEI